MMHGRIVPFVVMKELRSMAVYKYGSFSEQYLKLGIATDEIVLYHFTKE